MPRHVKTFRPFSRDLFLGIVLVFVPLFSLAAWWVYDSNARSLRGNFDNLRTQSEESLRLMLDLAESGYRMLELSVHARMEQAFATFLDELRDSGGDPARLDLALLRSKLGPHLDLYVINRDGVIVATTYLPDVGLDFRRWPDFYGKLRIMMDGEGFYPDVLAFETQTNRMRIYGYHPSPDHRYLLEIGFSSEGFDAHMGMLDPISFADVLKRLNRSIREIGFFDDLGRVLYVEEAEIKRMDLDYLRRVWKSESTWESLDPSGSTLTRAFYYAPKIDRIATDRGRVVRIVYSLDEMNRAIAETAWWAGLFLLLMTAAGMVLSWIMAGAMARPIHRMVDRIDRIASGEFGLTLPESARNELVVVERSVNSLACGLVRSLEDCRESEARLRYQNEHLEELVRQRSDKLIEAEKNAALASLVGGMVHEMATPIGVGLTAASHLRESISRAFGERSGRDVASILPAPARSEMRETVDLVLGSLERTTALLQRFKGIVVRPDEEVPSLFAPGPLARQVVSTALADRVPVAPEIELLIEDGLQLRCHMAAFTMILTQLVTNSIQHAFEGIARARVTIALEPADPSGRWRLTVSDNGSGMSAETRRRAFEPFFTTRLGRNSGLGLHIVYNLVKQSLGGEIWLEEAAGGGCRTRIEFPAGCR